MIIQNGQISKQELIKQIEENFKDDVPITIMCENSETGVGYNASIIEFVEPYLCEDTDELDSQIYLTF